VIHISFSGGKGSAVTALLAQELGYDFTLLFADTGIEDEDLHRFNADVAAAVGRPLVTLRDGRTPWDVYIDRKWIGNTRTAHCSDELKTKQVRKWLAENAQPEEALVLGMGWEEADRIERAQARWEPRPVVSLLKRQRVYRWQYDSYLSRHGIAPPRLYAQGYEHNNCGGFCCKAGQVQFARLLANNPERYAYHEAEMERAMASIGPTAQPFLRVTIGGNLEYLTLRQFREYVGSGGQVEMFSEAGCGCFTEEAA
jgi:3'-phosphoadenosine 5'-phosphosulfate sulfotransferase (PAPS reductase)/FAD synthetase